MLLISPALQRPGSPLQARRGLRDALPGCPARHNTWRQRRPQALSDAAAEALAEGDGGAAAVARSLAPAAEQQAPAGSGWRSWLPFSWVSSRGASGASAPSSSIATSEPAQALLESDGMAAALALLPRDLTAPQPVPQLQPKVPAAAPLPLQQVEEAAVVPAEGPIVFIPGAAAAAAAEAEADQGEYSLLLPGGIPLHHPVLELLRQRKWEGSRPGARGDAFMLGKGWGHRLVAASAPVRWRPLPLGPAPTAPCRPPLPPSLPSPPVPSAQAWCWRAAACGARSTAARCRC